MNLQDTVALYGNLSNIATALGGLVMVARWWCRPRIRTTKPPESTEIQLTAACDALQAQAELDLQ